MSADMDESDKPPNIESFVVATIAMWLSKMTPRECEDLAAKYFSYEILTKYGVNSINESKLAKVARNNDGLNDVLASRVVTAVATLKNLVPCPRFMIPPEQVEYIPCIPITGNLTVNESTVTSRLESLEKNHEVVMQALKEIRQSVSVQASAVVQNQAPVSFMNQGAGPSILLCPPPVGGQKTSTAAASRERSLSVNSNKSTSSKRSRDEALGDDKGDSWATVAGKGKRSKPKVQQGSGKVTISQSENAILPFDVYIGNTHPKSKPEIIERYLKECYENASSDIKPEEPFEVKNIECCTKPREDGKEPYCLNWRVSIDQRFRDYIMNPNAIPVGWTSRRYFPPRAKRPPPAELHPAKMPNNRQTALLKSTASEGRTMPESGDINSS